MLKDFLGREIKVGDTVIRAIASSGGARVEQRKVTHIVNGKIHLDNSHVPVNYPKRLVVITDLL